VTLREYGRKDKKSLIQGINGAGVVISQELPPPALRHVRKNGIRYIADLYDPLIIELLEYHRFATRRHQQNSFDYTYRNLLLQLNYADHILCASALQRDFYVGVMAGAKLLSAAMYHNDPTLRELISLAPFGLAKGPVPVRDQVDFYKKFPGIKKQDKVVLWGGGVWNWFDAIGVVRAMELISRQRQDIKLVFMGVKHPSPHVKVMKMAQTALDYCRRHDLLDKFVFFNFEWTPYEQRAAFLRRADIGVSAHFNSLETRFAFRTRILDYLWGDLPIVTTRGDAMAELVGRAGLGSVVDFEDPNGIARAITKLVDDSEAYRAAVRNIQKVKPQFYWEKIVADIAAIIERGEFTPRPLGHLKQCRLIAAFYWSAFKERYLA